MYVSSLDDPMVHYYEFYGAGLSCERQEIHYIQRKRSAGEEDITMQCSQRPRN